MCWKISDERKTTTGINAEQFTGNQSSLAPLPTIFRAAYVKLLGQNKKNSRRWWVMGGCSFLSKWDAPYLAGLISPAAIVLPSSTSDSFASTAWTIWIAAGEGSLGPTCVDPLVAFLIPLFLCALCAQSSMPSRTGSTNIALLNEVPIFVERERERIDCQTGTCRSYKYYQN